MTPHTLGDTGRHRITSTSFEASRGPPFVPLFLLPLLLPSAPGLLLYLTSLVSSNLMIMVVPH